MARYGQDMDWERGGTMGNRGWGRGRETEGGYGGGMSRYGGMRSEGYGAPYGGMRSDAYGGGWEDQDVARRGEFGWGGGTYDQGYTSGASWGRGGMRAGGYGAGGYGAGGYGAGYGGGYQTGYGGGYEQGWGGRGREEGRMRAADIMTDNPETVTPDATLAEAAKKMRDLNVGIIPVVESAESRRLRGVVTDRDIAVRAVAEGKDVNNMKVSDVMTSEVETCNKNDSVEDVLHVMESEQVRRVPITDREGRLVGIIAQADLAVEYGERSPERERRVEEAIERISEPARPRRGGMRAGGQTRGSQARGASE